jgi:hypothetical protein
MKNNIMVKVDNLFSFFFSSFENPSGLCRDYRLKENPDIPLVTANAAGDSNSNVSPGQSLSSHVDNHGDEGHSCTGEFDEVIIIPSYL